MQNEPKLCRRLYTLARKPAYGALLERLTNEPDDSYSFTFTTPGTYQCISTEHATCIWWYFI